MVVTIAEVAKAAGVSRATVSKALGRGYVSPEMRERVKRIAAEMHYRPSHIAQSLSLGKSGFVGVVATPSVIPVFASIVQPIEQSIRKAGYSLLFYTSSGDPESERVCLDDLIQKRVAGVIAIPSSNPADITAYQDVIDNDIKLVVIDRCIEGLPVPQVGGDDYMSARLATDYLVSLGHRRIVYLAIPRTSYAGRQREKGFLDSMSEAGNPVSKSSVIETGFGEEFGARAAAALLRRKERPTAVVARHDLVAIGAMRAFIAGGLSIPEDISIVGNSDISMNDMLVVPLTTVRHPNRQLAITGVRKLLNLLSGGHVEPEITTLPVELIVRKSCAPPRAS